MLETVTALESQIFLAQLQRLSLQGSVLPSSVPSSALPRSVPGGSSPGDQRHRQKGAAAAGFGGGGAQHEWVAGTRAGPESLALPMSRPSKTTNSAGRGALTAGSGQGAELEDKILALQSLARSDEAHEDMRQAAGLIGLTLALWGLGLLFAGSLLLWQWGALYYMVFGLASCAIGVLLFCCKRLALWVQWACVLAAPLWAFGGGTGATFFTVLIQSAPILLAALWMCVPQVRQALE